MLKKILLALLAIIFLLSLGIVYANKVFLPKKIKSLIINGLEQQTHKKVTLESLHFSIFKGLVIKNLIIQDGQKNVVTVAEADCSFLIWPFFKKQIIIPGMHVKKAFVYLERKPDNTFNISEFLPAQAAQAPKTGKGFNFFILKLDIIQSRIEFQDTTFSPPFTKSLEDVNLILNLSLPASLKFKLKSGVPTKGIPIKILASGEYKFTPKVITSTIEMKDFSCGEFAVYLRGLGVSVPAGLVNAKAMAIFKDDALSVNLEAKTKDLNLLKDQINCKLNSAVIAAVKYDVKNKNLAYQGVLNVAGSDISGLDFVEKLSNVNGVINFSNSGLSSDQLELGVYGIPCRIKFKLTDYRAPALSAQITSSAKLAVLKTIASDKFGLALPVELTGNAKFLLNVNKLASEKNLKFNGNADISGASLKFEKIKLPFEAINGHFEFTQDVVKFPDLNFKYSEVEYKASGAITNFQAPSGEIKLASELLSLQAAFASKNKVVNFSQLSGKYLNSDFALAGGIDYSQSGKLQADLNGTSSFNLEDSVRLLKQYEKQLEKIKPKGLVHAKFSLRGNINDLKSCFTKVDLSSSTISMYGLQTGEAVMDLSGAGGVIDIALLRLALYEGLLELNSRINLNSNDSPFVVNASIQNIKIEKLKLDTLSKSQDIAGNIQAQVNLSGMMNDPQKLSGLGQIMITRGKLWQLNLLKGIGKLIFTTDFTNVVFSEGACNFVVADKYISTDNLQLKSNLVNLNGEVRIGFDNSIAATISAQVSQDAPLTGSIQDVATTILGKAQKFGVIKISGTLKEPQYSFQPAVADIINTLKDIFWKK